MIQGRGAHRGRSGLAWHVSPAARHCRITGPSHAWGMGGGGVRMCPRTRAISEAVWRSAPRAVANIQRGARRPGSEGGACQRECVHGRGGCRTQANKAPHTCTSWPTCAAMCGSSALDAPPRPVRAQSYVQTFSPCLCCPFFGRLLWAKTAGGGGALGFGLFSPCPMRALRAHGLPLRGELGEENHTHQVRHAAGAHAFLSCGRASRAPTSLGRSRAPCCAGAAAAARRSVLAAVAASPYYRGQSFRWRGGGGMDPSRKIPVSVGGKGMASATLHQRPDRCSARCSTGPLGSPRSRPCGCC